MKLDDQPDIDNVIKQNTPNVIMEESKRVAVARKSVIKLQFEGVGGAPDKFRKSSLRKHAATRAAEADADRQYAKWKEGSSIQSMTIVDNFELSEDSIRQQIIATKLSGLKTVRTEYNAEEATALVIREIAIKINK